MLFALTLVDILQITLIFFIYYFYGYDIWMLPIFSFGGTLYVAFVEITSIMEPSDVKEKKQQEDFMRMLRKLVTENKDMKEKIVDILTQQNERDE